jgi:hypothetical protein
MIYWLVLVVYGIGTSGFTVTTQAMHVGNFPDLKACEAAGNNYICVQATDGKLPPP